VHTGRSSLERALGAWRDALGTHNVSLDAAARGRFERATFATTSRVPAVLRPATTREVQACVRIARREGIPLYPVSRGRNWGYGSAVPPADGCVAIDLSRMTRVLAHDEALGYVTVEPGVTFRALETHLAARRSRLVAPCVGSTSEGSLVGHALERGLGADGVADRWQCVCALEVVLPTGERIETGFARHGAGLLAPLHRWGIGPSLDGLFSQSNFGIVTRMTLWLDERPTFADNIWLGLDDQTQLASAVDAIRGLRRALVLRAPVVLSSGTRLLALATRYPWELAAGRTPLPRALEREILVGAGIPRWSGGTTLAAASREERRARRALVRAALDGLVTSLRVAPAATPAAADSNVNLRVAYWRGRQPIPDEPDPDRDGCGVLICAPVVPLVGRHVARAAGVVERTLRRHGFDAIYTISLHDDRHATLIAFIVYDRALAGADATARRCHDELLDRLAAGGYLPYRKAICARLPPANDARVRARIKAALDPAGILAPGRYDNVGLSRRAGGAAGAAARTPRARRSRR
jgi:4-cresol dehydrogenase (hydroxylating)